MSTRLYCKKREFESYHDWCLGGCVCLNREMWPAVQWIQTHAQPRSRIDRRGADFYKRQHPATISPPPSSLQLCVHDCSSRRRGVCHFCARKHTHLLSHPTSLWSSLAASHVELAWVCSLSKFVGIRGIAEEMVVPLTLCRISPARSGSDFLYPEGSDLFGWYWGIEVEILLYVWPVRFPLLSCARAAENAGLSQHRLRMAFFCSSCDRFDEVCVSWFLVWIAVSK